MTEKKFIEKVDYYSSMKYPTFWGKSGLSKKDARNLSSSDLTIEEHDYMVFNYLTAMTICGQDVYYYATDNRLTKEEREFLQIAYSRYIAQKQDL